MDTCAVVGRAELCPFGCYWECEHRTPSSAAAALKPVYDAQGRELRRCRECGDLFYGAIEHAREHERLRQLGQDPALRWLP